LNGAYRSLEVWHVDGDLRLVTHRRQGLSGATCIPPRMLMPGCA
jgi:hypothetical protein